MGFADRPGVPAVARPSEPMDRLRHKTARQAETEATHPLSHRADRRRP
jgi:hypothetical protein